MNDYPNGETESIPDQIEDSSSTEAECQEIEYEYWDSDSIEELTEFFFQDYEYYLDQTAEEIIQDIEEETYGDKGNEQ